MKIKTWDLSGFGGDYENALQKMVWTGVEFLQKNNIKSFRSEQSPNLIGIAINQGETGKAFDKAILDCVKDYGASGAMHQYATNHARYIATHGYKKWFNELLEHREGQPFEFEYSGIVDLEAGDVMVREECHDEKVVEKVDVTHSNDNNGSLELELRREMNYPIIVLQRELKYLKRNYEGWRRDNHIPEFTKSVLSIYQERIKYVEKAIKILGSDIKVNNKEISSEDLIIKQEQIS